MLWANARFTWPTHIGHTETFSQEIVKILGLHGSGFSLILQCQQPCTWVFLNLLAVHLLVVLATIYSNAMNGILGREVALLYYNGSRTTWTNEKNCEMNYSKLHHQSMPFSPHSSALPLFYGSPYNFTTFVSTKQIDFWIFIVVWLLII